nr:MAG TPA: hypothetical protein [Caudoviricetes sp.]
MFLWYISISNFRYCGYSQIQPHYQSILREFCIFSQVVFKEVFYFIFYYTLFYTYDTTI